ncbi:MAG: DegT/DnrJ/EryC1/StrS aminotransferase family protein, partial [Candidatus Omnitrophica bacterium]|nr:DegT/DnrJ/EryC1/StrS aminotransferase family protein [Candidatus Omnitrophota bacterium]
DKLLKFLNSRGIGARIYYRKPLYEMKLFKSPGLKKIFNNTQQASAEVLSLPMHPFLKEKDISFIAKNIKDFYK